jgi:hypothetical protein
MDEDGLTKKLNFGTDKPYDSPATQVCVFQFSMKRPWCRGSLLRSILNESANVYDVSCSSNWRPFSGKMELAGRVSFTVVCADGRIAACDVNISRVEGL